MAELAQFGVLGQRSVRIGHAMRNRLRAVAPAAVLVVFVISAFILPVGGWLIATVQWVRNAGLVGVSVYAASYILATALMVPGSVLTAGAGFLYGPIRGILLVSPASVIAATIAFLLGRFAARDWVRQRVARYPHFHAIDNAIGKSGFMIVLLLRISPIFPFNLLNYALGLTGVRLIDYVAASLIGMFPGTFLYVYLGSLATNASELLGASRAAGGTWTQALYWGGLLATVALTVLITRIARAALVRALSDTPAG